MTDERNGNDEVEEMELIDGEVALMAVDKAAIDMQITTAKAHPRSITGSLREAQELATLDPETAASCFYSLPRSGKKIEGPSVRLAEIMAYSWGNLRVDADIVAEDATHVTAMGTCFDLEKNIAVRVRVKRRITGRNGQRYNADMIGVTSNAAISIALRNAVFKVIPAAFVRRTYAEARRASLGEGTMQDKRQNAWMYFAKLDVTKEQIYALLDIKGWDDLGEDELITLRGLATAIKDGDTTVEQTFNPPKTSEKTADLNAALQGAGEAEQDTEGPADEPAEGSATTASKPAGPPAAVEEAAGPSDPVPHLNRKLQARQELARLCEAESIPLGKIQTALMKREDAGSVSSLTAEHYENGVRDFADLAMAYLETLQ